MRPFVVSGLNMGCDNVTLRLLKEGQMSFMTSNSKSSLVMRSTPGVRK
ncbi:hypothetical protein ACED62_26765 [Vibrio splendidus]